MSSACGIASRAAGRLCSSWRKSRWNGTITLTLAANPPHSTRRYVGHNETEVCLKADNLRGQDCKESPRTATRRIRQVPSRSVAERVLHFGRLAQSWYFSARRRAVVRCGFSSETMSEASPTLRTVRQIRPGDHVVVIGAGPAGLTAAYVLAQKTNARITVLEGDDTVGGISRTVQYNGYRF